METKANDSVEIISNHIEDVTDEEVDEIVSRPSHLSNRSQLDEHEPMTIALRSDVYYEFCFSFSEDGELDDETAPYVDAFFEESLGIEIGSPTDDDVDEEYMELTVRLSPDTRRKVTGHIRNSRLQVNELPTSGWFWTQLVAEGLENWNEF